MSGIDITERIRVQRICAAGGMALADKLARQKPEPTRFDRDDNPDNLRFGDVFWNVVDNYQKILEKTTK